MMGAGCPDAERAGTGLRSPPLPLDPLTPQEQVTMSLDGYAAQLPDIDPGETQEWLDSLDAVVDSRGKTRARFLLSRLTERARENQVGSPAEVNTPYLNTIPSELQPWFPGNEKLEQRLRAFI